MCSRVADLLAAEEHEGESRIEDVAGDTVLGVMWESPAIELGSIFGRRTER